jgi:hypothetical protein
VMYALSGETESAWLLMNQRATYVIWSLYPPTPVDFGVSLPHHTPTPQNLVDGTYSSYALCFAQALLLPYLILNWESFRIY